MHEFAIAQDIVISLGEKLGNDINLLTGIDIETGAFSGIVDDSLMFGLETLLLDRGIKDVKIGIIHKSAEAVCNCGRTYLINDIFELCPDCGSAGREIPHGTDISVTSVSMRETEND
jgi:Zn finger protein HypA/HybF involved in hydrogenase expression